MHVFVEGRHGVGLAPDDEALSMWPKLCEAWMRREGFLAPTSASGMEASANEAEADTSEAQRIVFFGDSITEAGDKEGGYVRLIADSLQGALPRPGHRGDRRGHQRQPRAGPPGSRRAGRPGGRTRRRSSSTSASTTSGTGTSTTRAHRKRTSRTASAPLPTRSSRPVPR